MLRTRVPIAVLISGTTACLLLGGAAPAASQSTTETSTQTVAAPTGTVAAAVPPKGVIIVEPGEDTLHDAVDEAEPGDTLVLEPGLYVLTHTVLIEKDLTIQGATGKRKDVHIAGVREDFDFEPEIFGEELQDLKNWGHLLFVRPPAQKVVFRDFTIKGAPEIEAIDELTCEAVFQLNHTECFGDAIHTDGVAYVEVRHVEASLNGGNGIWVDGAQVATFRDILGVNNGAFGIDVDTALDLSVRDSTFIANQVSGLEASGHEFGTPKDLYVAKVSIKDTVAKGNSEIGIEVERFQRAKMENITCADNLEDGFDADRVIQLEIKKSEFINNLDDGIEVFPFELADPNEQPADFPGSTIEVFRDLDFSGNMGEEVHHPPTEN